MSTERPTGKERELYYNYNREERLARRSDRYESAKGGLFRRNRSLAIILLDVMVILLIFGIFRVFVFGGDNQPELMEYRFSMSLLETSQGALALVNIRAPAEPADTSGIVTVTFRPAGSSSEGAGPADVKDLLPEPGNERRISELFPEGTTQVDALVSIDDGKLELSATLDDSY